MAELVATEGQTENVEIPCEGNRHWRRIRLFIPVEAKHFAFADFQEKLGLREQSLKLLLAESAEAECHSHVSIELVQRDVKERGENEDEKSLNAAAEFYAVEIRTLRERVTEAHQGAEYHSHRDFISAARQTMPGDTILPIGATVDLYYDVETSRWKPSLLAESPGFGEFDEKLGTISLAGVTLRFEKSSVGLRRVELDTSPFGDEYLVSLSFAYALRVDKLECMYRSVLDQAEEFSSLFINEKLKQK